MFSPSTMIPLKPSMFKHPIIHWVSTLPDNPLLKTTMQHLKDSEWCRRSLMTLFAIQCFPAMVCRAGAKGPGPLLSDLSQSARTMKQHQKVVVVAPPLAANTRYVKLIMHSKHVHIIVLYTLIIKYTFTCYKMLQPNTIRLCVVVH
jgi:hypothetical protein